MKIILIGGAGFIGDSIVKVAQLDGIKCVVIDSQSRLERNAKALDQCKTLAMEYPHVDKQLLKTIINPGDVLIHLACTTNPSKSMQDIAYDAHTNIAPSIEIFECAIQNKADKIIFASSGGTVYGKVLHSPITESHKTSPICAYGVSKLAIENYLQLMTSETQTRGISLRIGNPYGSYQLKGTTIGAIAAFLTATLNIKTINIWGNGEIIRDYIHIDDVSQAFLSAINKQALAGIFNIGSGLGHSINQILEVIQKITGIEPQLSYQKSRGFDVPKIVLDPTKFQKQTNWRLKNNLETGIRHTLDNVKP